MGYLAILISISAVIYFFVMSRTDKNGVDRLEFIEMHVQAMGGTVDSIEQMKKSECPYNEALGLNQDLVYVPYKVTYRLEYKAIEGWAILVIKGTYFGSIGLSEDEWIFKL